MIDRNNNAITR